MDDIRIVDDATGVAARPIEPPSEENLPREPDFAPPFAVAALESAPHAAQHRSGGPEPGAGRTVFSMRG
jgi:hypothetical protein